jgi:hypothetical protein
MCVVSQCREPARRVYYGAVFEIKKGFPDYRNLRKTRMPYPAWGITRKLYDIFEDMAERQVSHPERLASS